MPLPIVSSTVEIPYNRMKHLFLSGSLQDTPGVTQPSPGGVALIQSTASAATQLITTTGQPAKSAFVYITQGTVAVTSSTNAGIAAAPPYTGMGAALYFDATRNKLSIYSTVNGDWFSVSLSSS